MTIKKSPAFLPGFFFLALAVLGGESVLVFLAGRTRSRARLAAGGLDLAGQLAAALDLDLAVGDLAAHLAGRVDDQAVADDELAFEQAADFGVFDLGRALERTVFSDLDR